MNRLSKLLPNPLAGFMCTHVRMSISVRVVEVKGTKISVTSWRTKCWDGLCMRHCVHALTTPRPALSSSSCTVGLWLLCMSRGRKGVGLSQRSSWCLLWSYNVNRALGSGARSCGEDRKLRNNQSKEHHISQALTHRKMLCSGTADGMRLQIIDATPMTAAVLGIIKVKW